MHPVERLYGSSPALEMKNAHCATCHKCVEPCADSTPAMDPARAKGTRIHTLVTLLMIGGFPGFIWGWFQVPDYAGAEGWRHLGQAYGWPLLGAAASLAAYLLLTRTTLDRVVVSRVFAAAAISCYYWYRLPALFGFGPFPGDGMLVDLRATLPAAFPTISRIATTILFAWWIVGRRNVRRAWARRPSYA